MDFNYNALKPALKTTIFQNQHILERWANDKRNRQSNKHSNLGIFSPLVFAIKMIVGAILVSISFIPIFIAKICNMLIEKYKIYRKPDSLLATIRKMKNQEEADKLRTMKRTLEDFQKIKNLSPTEGAKNLTKDLSTKLKDAKLEKERAIRYILRAISQNEPFDPLWIKLLSDQDVVNQVQLLFENKEGFYKVIRDKSDSLNPNSRSNLILALSNIFPENLLEIFEKARKKTLKSEERENLIKNYENLLENLLHIIKSSTSHKNPASTNQKLIKALRSVILSPVYQALKQDPQEPSVHFIHRLASDIWNKAPSMSAYREVGVSIMNEMSLSTLDNHYLDGATLAKHLDNSHKKMSKLLHTDYGILGKLTYGLTHPFQLLGAMASEGGFLRAIASTLGRGIYDPHGKLGNNPSLQGTSTVHLKNNRVATFLNCYGGSPTIGDNTISPEFQAVIQAAENNQTLPSEAQDPNIPTMVIYNNLQNLDKEYGERPRSQTIMLLNRKYPLSFRGTTFSKDSALYMMTNDSVSWRDAKQFEEVMRCQVNKSFVLNEREHGFYFHGPHHKWDQIFDQVFKNATENFTKLVKEDPSLEPKELQGAYQEYVYSLLNSVIEIETAYTLINREIHSPVIMTINACKENIDRGGMENTKYLYNELEKNHSSNPLPLIMGAMHSRALSARDRMILKKRMPQILSYMRLISPETFQKNRKQVLSSLGYDIEKTSYQPDQQGQRT